MRRHLYEIALSEEELREIIAALCGVEVKEPNCRHRLAKRFESELWAPYHAEIAQSRHATKAERKTAELKFWARKQ